MSIYCFDIDNTICETEGTDYANAKPIPWMVDAIKRLAQAGHTIRYYTARGAGEMTNESITEALALTMRQIKEWGLPDGLGVMLKPPADIYVDDRAKLPLEFRMDFLAGNLERGHLYRPDAVLEVVP